MMLYNSNEYLKSIKTYLNRKTLFFDKKFGLPRYWSNRELKKIAHLFKGDVINVSAWNDLDKEGKKYKDYFFNSKSYSISNYNADTRGLQGDDGEIFLDLTQELDNSLIKKYDVVFNHTTLEHIYEVKKEFKNLCLMTKDIVILIIPFLQQMHGDFGDYWRFTPSTIKKLFEENNFSLIYLTFNDNKNAFVYIFAIGTRHPNLWKKKIYNKFSYVCKEKCTDPFNHYIGCRSISNSFIFNLKQRLVSL